MTPLLWRFEFHLEYSSRLQIPNSRFRYKPELIGLLDCLNDLDKVATSVPHSTPTVTNPLSNTAANKETATNDKCSEDTTKDRQSVSSTKNEDVAQPEVIQHKAIVWTSKDRSTQHGDNLKTNGTNQKSDFQVKIPGGAMKHEHDVTQSDQHDQLQNGDPDNLDAHVMNYETQL